MPQGIAKADSQDRREATVELIRREWAEAPTLRPTLRNTVGYSVVLQYESKADAEAVHGLLKRLDSDMAELLLAAKASAPPKPKKPRRTTCLYCEGAFTTEWQRTFCSPACGNRHRGDLKAEGGQTG